MRRARRMEIGIAFAINGVTVDLDNELLTDASGRPVGLRRQCFAVLRQLSRHADQLVTKEDLAAAIWPGIAVTDDSLVQCIHEIRCAIGDEGHTVLKTVRKRGYRLVFTPNGNSPPGSIVISPLVWYVDQDWPPSLLARSPAFWPQRSFGH